MTGRLLASVHIRVGRRRHPSRPLARGHGPGGGDGGGDEGGGARRTLNRKWPGQRRRLLRALGAFCLRYPLPRPCIDTATLAKCKNSSEVLRELGEAEVAAQGSDTFTLEAPPATGRWRRRRLAVT